MTEVARTAEPEVLADLPDIQIAERLRQKIAEACELINILHTREYEVDIKFRDNDAGTCRAGTGIRKTVFL